MLRNGTRGRGARGTGGPGRRKAPARPPSPSLGLLVVASAALLAGCAPAPPPAPPAPGGVEGPSEPEAPAEPTSRAAPGAHPEVEPPPPWLPPRIRWEPDGPREASAISVWVEVPRAGRRPADVEGEIDGRPVRFQRVGNRWFGIGALPIGSAGSPRLTLRLRIDADSVVERVAMLSVRDRSYASMRLRVAPRYSRPPPEVLERIEGERRRIRATLASVTPEWLAEAPFEWPRPPRITSPFGQRRVFNGELQSRHLGTDLGGHTGAPVRAASGGRVALVGHFYYQGNAVYLDHGLGTYTGYFHLSRIDVREGERVVRGQRLGAVGATGRVTGPHLHWSLYVGGENLDPASLLELELPPPGSEASVARQGGTAP